MHHFLIRGCVGKQKTPLVAAAESSNNSCGGQRRVDYGDVIRKFVFKDLVVLRATEGQEAVTVCKLCEDANLTGIFELNSYSHRVVAKCTGK